MTTEKEIIYSILNTIRSNEHNEDESISERLMRAYIATYRAEILRKYYKNGHTVNDQVFQNIPLVVRKQNLLYKVDLPEIIRFHHNYGMYLSKDGIDIPIQTSEEFNLSRKNPFNKKRILAKTDTKNLFFNVPEEIASCFEENSEIKLLFDLINSEIEEDKQDPKFSIDLYCVLQNPDLAPDYNWEISAYPFPSEKIDELKTMILRKEFNIMTQAKTDEVQNGRSDNIRYHENQNINGSG